MTIYHEYQKFIIAERGMSPLPPTPSDIEGPFYKAGVPFLMQLCANPTLFLSGQVLTEMGQPILDAVLDFWQADEKGVYDNDGFKLRGKVSTAAYSRYILETIRPGDYQIADNPPDFRCAHIHVKVTANGLKPLTTQLYFADDKYNATDHWFDPKRVVRFDKDGQGRFDFVLEAE